MEAPLSQRSKLGGSSSFQEAQVPNRITFVGLGRYVTGVVAIVN